LMDTILKQILYTSSMVNLK